jgi:hypothetical protein
LCIIAINIYAQDETVKDLKKASEKVLKKIPTIPSQNLESRRTICAQCFPGIAQQLGSGGDEFSLSLNSVLNLYAFYKKDRHSWDNTFDFNLGYVKTRVLAAGKMMTASISSQSMDMR